MSDSVDTTVDTTSSRERIKRALSHGKKGRINKDLSNKIMLGVFRAAAYITTLVLVAIIAYVVVNGLPHISLDFIFGWPQGVNAEGGIWPTIGLDHLRDGRNRHAYLHARSLCMQPSIWPSTPSRARSSSSFATLLTLWPRCPPSLWACLATPCLSRLWAWAFRWSRPLWRSRS